MLHPTIDELTKGKYNRYELALATARCARIITNEYVRQHEAAERAQTGNKETDKPINTMIDHELRDEKAVKVAIGRIYSGAYLIDECGEDAEVCHKLPEENSAEETASPADAEAEAPVREKDPDTEEVVAAQ